MGAWLTPVLLCSLGGRSGTTLAMQMLGTSPAIAFDRVHPYEHRYFTYLARHARSIDRAGEQRDTGVRARIARRVAPRPAPRPGLPFTPEIVTVDGLVSRSMVHLWEAFSEEVTARDPLARCYAEKAEVVTVAAAPFPVHVVQLIRDPRDVWASTLAFDRQRGFYGFGRRRGQSQRDFLDAFIAQVTARAASMSTPPPGSRTLRVRYEEMVSDVPASAGEIGAWLGVTLGVPAPDAQTRAHMTSGSAAASIGRWRTDLDADEQRLLCDGLAPVLVDLGYA